MISLEVLICTYGDRITQIDVAGLPHLDEVAYVVCCQNPEGTAAVPPALAARPDISVHFFADRGLSVNRNHAFDVATAPYVLISDDDISYSAAGLRAIIEAFGSEEAPDIVTTRSEIPEHHVYPPHGHDLAAPYRFYAPISFEIALRRSALEASGLRFPPLAGIGAPFVQCAEEQFFMRRALAAGLRGKYLDTLVSRHHGPTTCTRSARQAGVVRGKGAFMTADRGIAGAVLRFPLEAWRSAASAPKAFVWLWQGLFYYLRHRREL